MSDHDELLSPMEQVIGVECSKCHKLKKAREYNKHPSKRNGLQSMCKECQKDTSRKVYAQKKLAKKFASLVDPVD